MNAIQALSSYFVSAKADFTIQEPWQRSAERISLIALKILIVPWGIVEGLRFLLGRVILIFLYPAQSDLVKYLIPKFRAKNVELVRNHTMAALRQKGLLVQPLLLEKKGVRYSGLTIERSTARKGKWLLHAVGNGQTIEEVASDIEESPLNREFNILLVNGPAIGSSQGIVSAETIGDAQEVALRYLEEAKKPSHIIMSGYSLGAAAISQAILQHTFRPDIDYHAVRLMTFDRASHICEERVTIATKSPLLGTIVKLLVKFSGLEMDSIAASRKLAKLNIPEIIVQAIKEEANYLSLHNFASDGLIGAETSLGYQLVKERLFHKKTFIGIPGAGHFPENLYQLR